jgi:Polysaccharide pyruvyl transferase
LAASSHNGIVIGSLKASTENLGDYIQILACLGLLERFDLRPSIYLDRDTELASAPALERCSGRVLLPLSGWFKHTVGADPQWPPHDKIIPVFIGFHIRPHQCPALLEPHSIDYMKAHGPVGCRDPFTLRVLEERGVPSYLSHCLSLTFARRKPEQAGDTVVVASRDREIIDVLPPEYRNDHVYVNHYTIRDGFSDYLTEAKGALEFYRTRARLVITTFLHCALPCVAMGIPVIAFLPRPQYDFQKTSDEERFSGLMRIAPVHRFGDTSGVDWTPRPIDVEGLKETIVLDFHNRVAAALAAAR